MKRILVAISAATGICSPAQADEQSYPKISGELSIEIENDWTYSSDDAAVEFYNLYPTVILGTTVEFTPTISLNFEATAEPVEDTTEDSVFKDVGGYINIITANYDTDRFSVYAGKFTANFGVVWNIAPGIYGVDLSEKFLGKLTFYTQTLAVPVRRNVNAPDVQTGEEIFSAIGCNACHIPTFTTGNHRTVPALSGQTIHPFTDLLLHDMGDGLADNRPDFDANGREWRTAPLWEIGLTMAVNKHTRFLHDGRARSVQEAILWHGGEAEKAKEQYRVLPVEQRTQLLAFINSL